MSDYRCDSCGFFPCRCPRPSQKEQDAAALKSRQEYDAREAAKKIPNAIAAELEAQAGRIRRRAHQFEIEAHKARAEGEEMSMAVNRMSGIVLESEARKLERRAAKLRRAK